MNRTPARLALLVVAALATSTPPAAQASWTNDGVLASTAGCRSNSEMHLFRDGFGGLPLAWRWTSNGSIVMTQRITTDGALSPGWPSAGQIGGEIAGAPAIDTAPDGSGGMFLVRQVQSNIYLQHLRLDGTFDPAWPSFGVAIAATFNIEVLPRVVSDGAGGALVAWLTNYSRLCIQRIQSNGLPAPGWPAAGVVIVNASPGLLQLSPPGLVPDGAGGAFVMWLADVARATHVTGTGAIADDWPTDGLPLGSTAPELNTPVLKLLPSGGNSLIAMWLETSGGYRFMVQRFGRDGTIDPDWSGDGFVAYNTSTAFRRDIAGVSDGQGGLILVWLEGADIRALRVLSSASIAPGWTASGVSGLGPGAVIDPTYSSFAAASGPQAGAIVAWDDWRAGDPFRLVQVRARWLLGDGTSDPNQPDTGRVVNSSWPAGSVGAMVGDGKGGAFVAWQQVDTLTSVFSLVRVSDLTYIPPVSVPDRVAPARIALRSPAPNPASREVAVHFELAGATPARLELLDLAGRRVRAMSVSGTGEQVARFEDLGALPPGVYLVRLVQGASMHTSRVAVLH